MRLKILTLTLAISVIAALSRHAQGAGDPISGEWDVSFLIEGMTTPATFTFSLVDGKVTGTVYSHHTGAGTLRDGTFKDNRLACTLDFSSHESIAIIGELKNGELTGEFRTEGRVGKWEGRRKAPGGHAHAAASPSGAHPPSPYRPYENLIGEWDVAPESGGAPVAGALFRWGPNHSYVWFAGSLLVNGSREPHFEGMLMWNGVHKNLDVLMAMDLRYGLAQEQGTLSVEPDGTIVRDITAVFSEGVQPIGLPAVGAEGATAHFRQTFKPVGPDRMLTAAMRQTGGGWVATFPGSDHLVMTRRKDG